MVLSLFSPDDWSGGGLSCDLDDLGEYVLLNGFMVAMTCCCEVRSTSSRSEDMRNRKKPRPPRGTRENGDVYMGLGNILPPPSWLPLRGLRPISCHSLHPCCTWAKDITGLLRATHAIMEVDKPTPDQYLNTQRAQAPDEYKEWWEKLTKAYDRK